MRRSRYCSPRSRSACCPSERICRPGCRLPCCAPTRRCTLRSTASTRIPNRCSFVPPPARTTRRYCGDSCSPPPPACTPRPCRPRRPSCEPCGRPKPLGSSRRPRPLSSSCTYSRSLRPFSNFYNCTEPCRPRKCEPIEPCVSRLSDRCEPCTYPSLLTPPSCYIGTCNKPRRSRQDISYRCRPRVCGSGYSSSCGSSYCESSYSRRSCTQASLRCQVCHCDPCCCYLSDSCGREKPVKCALATDTPRGPTSWFLKKSEEAGKNKSPTEPHFCPWEAEVTVTGTVRGHCTSTAVDVAKRLTGKFSSRGQKYTTCKKKDGGDECSESTTKPQKMTMGYLDDGTKLDFSRNKCEEDEDVGQDTKPYIQGRTNNATTDSTAASHRLRSCWVDFEDRGGKDKDKEKITFATAYIDGGSAKDIRNQYTNKEEGNSFGVCTQSDIQSSRLYRSMGDLFGHGQCKRNRRNSLRQSLEASDADRSSYETAPETMREGAHVSLKYRHPYPAHETQHTGYAKRKGRRKTIDDGIYGENCRSFNGRRKNTRRHKNDYNNWDECRCVSADGENDVIKFDLLNNDDWGNNSDHDDIDRVDFHLSPSRWSIEDRRARSSGRRYVSPISYKRQNTELKVRRTRRRHSRTSGNRKHTSNPSYADLDAADSGRSSEGELGKGRSSHTLSSTPFDKSRRRECARESSHRHRRKRVTYDGA